MKSNCSNLTIIALCLLWSAAVLAEPQHTSAQVSAGGNGDIEAGATQPSQVEMGASAHGHVGDPPRSHGGARIALQGRLDALNMLNFSTPDVANSHVTIDGWRLLVPMVTPGVRLLETKLFLGLGLGLSGVDVSNGNTDSSRSGWSLSPLATYDILSDQLGALSLLGWLNLGHLGDSETCNNNNCVTTNNSITGWGVGLGAGLRGFISQGLALGGEFGWSFLSLPQNNGPDAFVHGLFGNIFLEASVGI
jgi:hypothetical protein